MTNMINLVIGGNTKRSRTGQHPVSIDFDALPEASKSFIVNYGLKQYLADGMAGADNYAEAAQGIEARVAKLQSGDLSRARGEGTAKADTVEGRALKLARDAIRASLKAANQTAEKELIAEAAKEFIKSDASFMKEAKKQLEQEAAGKAALSGSDALASIMSKLVKTA